MMMEAALAGRSTGPFANRGMMLLNFNLVISLISSYATGYDGSMMSKFLVTKDDNFMNSNKSRRTANTRHLECILSYSFCEYIGIVRGFSRSRKVLIF